MYEGRQEVGIRGERADSLADQLAVPVPSLHILPDSVDSVLGALVEPGGNALRAARAAGVGSGDRARVLGNRVGKTRPTHRFSRAVGALQD